MTFFIYILILFLISFFLRLVFLLTEGTDFYSHLWMVKERNRHRDLRQHNVQQTTLHGYRGYPPLTHFIVGLFPQKYWPIAGRMLNIFYDCISVLLVFFVSYLVFKNLWHLNIDVSFAAFITSLLYSTTPILFPITARLKAMGDRTIGGLFNNIFIILFALGYIYSNPWPYILCVPFILLIIISSQFGMQNIIWICFFLSIVLWSIIPIVLLLAGFLLSLLPIFDGTKILYRKYSHYKWYINYLRENTEDEIGVQGRNRLRDIILLPYYFFKNIKKAYLIAFRQNSFLIAAYSLPIIYPLLFFIFSKRNDLFLISDGLFLFVSYLIIAAFLIFILTSLRPLLFLGQAERYFEYASFPLNLMGVYLITKFSDSPIEILLCILIVNIIFICVLFIASNITTIGSRFKNIAEGDFIELVSFLKKMGKAKVITLPTKFAFQISYLLDDKTSFYYDNICDPDTGMDYMLEEHVKLHFFLPDFKYFHKKYGIDTFVFSLDAIKDAERRGINYNLKDLDEIFRNKTFIVGRYPVT